ncbi:hypothetical protein [Vulgatibacter sp.]|uniref:hypothetical protein n=1 Tax=Vulgatibacter sp. TaxID=1971226 RepID=UPI003569D076
MKPTIILPACALLLTGCATTPAAPAAEETVELRFRPEAGATEVHSERIRTIRAGGNEQVQRTTTRYTGTALEVPEGVAYGAENVRVESDYGPPVLHELGAQAAERFQMVVSPDAEIVAFRGLDELQAGLLAWFEEQPQVEGLPPQAREQLRAVIEQVSDPEMLATHAASDFYLEVGAWHGKTLELGRWYQSEDPAHAYAATGRIPCTEGEEEARCVRLELTSAPSEAELAQARQMMAQLFAALPAGAEPGPIEIQDRFELVAEPDGLRPWRMRKVRTMESELTVQGEKQRIEVEDLRTTTFARN